MAACLYSCGHWLAKTNLRYNTIHTPRKHGCGHHDAMQRYPKSIGTRYIIRLWELQVHSLRGRPAGQTEKHTRSSSSCVLPNWTRWSSHPSCQHHPIRATLSLLGGSTGPGLWPSIGRMVVTPGRGVPRCQGGGCVCALHSEEQRRWRRKSLTISAYQHEWSIM